MKLLISTFFVIALGLSGASADLRDNAFLQKLKGTWEGEGEITNADQETSVMTNRIVAAFVEGENRFTVEGNLGLDGEDAMQYRWVYEPHTLEGLYLATFYNLTDPEAAPVEHEGSIDETNLSATLRSTSPGGGGTAQTQRIEDGVYHVEFQFMDNSGNVYLSGNIALEPVD